MAYGYVMDVPAPIELYDAVHAEVGRRTAAVGGAEGLLLHVGRQTRDGFQVTEVWESKEQCDRFNDEIVGPAIAQLSAGQAPAQEPAREEFEPRGLIVPAANVAV
jgi:hypothetical protein